MTDFDTKKSKSTKLICKTKTIVNKNTNNG